MVCETLILFSTMIDPVSAIANILGISSAGLHIIETLSAFRDRYNAASRTINAICTESSTLNASICQIQSMLYGRPDMLRQKFDQMPSLKRTFDHALTELMMLYHGLEEEMKGIRSVMRDCGPSDRCEERRWQKKFKMAWKENKMVVLLEQIRGQQIHMSVLLHGLQM
jgi:hypothetical protein